MNKTNTTTGTVETVKPEEKPEPQVMIRITQHGARIGSLICAVGHQQRVPESVGKRMQEHKLAEIIGV